MCVCVLLSTSICALCTLFTHIEHVNQIYIVYILIVYNFGIRYRGSRYLVVVPNANSLKFCEYENRFDLVAHRRFPIPCPKLLPKANRKCVWNCFVGVENNTEPFRTADRTYFRHLCMRTYNGSLTLTFAGFIYTRQVRNICIKWNNVPYTTPTHIEHTHTLHTFLIYENLILETLPIGLPPFGNKLPFEFTSHSQVYDACVDGTCAISCAKVCKYWKNCLRCYHSLNAVDNATLLLQKQQQQQQVREQ